MFWEGYYARIYSYVVLGCGVFDIGDTVSGMSNETWGSKLITDALIG